MSDPTAPPRRLPLIAWAGAALLVLGVGCRLFRFAMNFPAWQDEASLAFNFVERDYLGLLRELNYWQVAPLLFLWAEKAIYEWLGPSMLALRLLPLAAGIGGLLLFWELARKYLSAEAAVLAVGILAVSSWPIEMAATLKPYAVDLLVSVALLRLALLVLDEPSRPRGLILLTLLIPFAVVSSYPAVFVAGAVSLVLLPRAWRGGWGRRGWFLAFNGLLVASFLAHFLLVGREKDPSNPPDLMGFMWNFWRQGFPHDGWLRSLAWALRVHVGKMTSYPVEFNGGGLLGLTLMCLGVHALLRRGRPSLPLLCLLPYALHLLAALLRRYPYGMHPRLEQHLLPGFCILAGSGLAYLIECLAAAPARRALAVGACAGLLALVGARGLVSDARRPYHDELADWARQVVCHLRDAMPAGEPVIIPGTVYSCPLPLRWQLLSLDHPIVESGQGWLLSTQHDQPPPGVPEPGPCFPDREHRRFRALLPDGETKVYRYFCDVYPRDPVGRATVRRLPQ